MKKKQTMKEQIKKRPVVRVENGKLIVDLSSEADWIQKRRKGKKKGG